MYSKNVYIFEELVYDNKRKILALNILRCEHLSREKETGFPECRYHTCQPKPPVK